MILTHRARLCLGASLVASILLAALFGSVLVITRQNAVSQREYELKSAMGALAGDPTRLEVDDFDESNPDKGFTLYKADGTVVEHGRFHAPKILGFQSSDRLFSYGIKRDGLIIVVSSDWRAVAQGLHRIEVVLLLLWVPLILLSAVLSWFAARSVFLPLERLTEQAAKIGGTHLSDRLSTSDRAEFGVFAQHLNRMLSRLEETAQREDQFSSDAAHELRTPLALLRTRIETTLLRERTVSEYVSSYGLLLAEVDRLTRIVEALLRTARRAPEDVGPTDLEPLLLECTGRWQEQFVAAQVYLDTETQPALTCIAQEEFVVVVDNLLDNALRYSAPGSTVWVQLVANKDRICLTVRDEGPGISAALGERIFDRFVRSDDDRSRSSGGAGIGLAVCKKIMTSREGSIHIRRDDTSGTTIECVFRVDAQPIEVESG